jgi:molecular chaperone DnaJ
MRVPPGTQSGTLFRLRGKGLGGANRGDAHVRLVVETPTQLTARQRALLEELGATLGEEQAPGRAKFMAKVKELLG